MFEIPASLLAWLYSLVHNYAIAIALIAVVVMIIITPLTLKSTKGMLEMQRLAPDMRRLQQQYRNDRQKLNEEMMKLYQEHKVNPMSSCLPLLAQMPIFIIMFRVLHGLTYRPVGASNVIANGVLAAANQPTQESLGFVPRYISHQSDLFQSLFNAKPPEMLSFGLDLAISPVEALRRGFGTGLIYAILVVLLGGLYFLQQRMVAARAAVSPTMSPRQQKLMQYLPVAFAFFQMFFLTGLVIYYAAQAVLRIGQQAYITRRFYGHDESLGRQAQRAGEQAREIAKQDGGSGGGGGIFAQARRDLAGAKGGGGGDGGGSDGNGAKAAKDSAPAPVQATSRTGGSKRTTPPKNRPTPSGKAPSSRPRSGPPAGRPGGQRTKSGSKRRR